MISQEALASVIAVGAINADTDGNGSIASYSNQGPSTIFTDFGTQTKVERQSLDVAGIDQVATWVGNNGAPDVQALFKGTSAAAPSVAGIVALMLNAAASGNSVDVTGATTRTGNITSGSTTVSGISVETGDLAIGMSVTGLGIPAGSRITSIPSTTSIVISSAPGSSSTGVVLSFGALFATATDLLPGGYDNTVGNGRANALEAVYRAFTPSAPALVSDNGRYQNDRVTSIQSLTFTGTAPAGSYVALYVDGSGPFNPQQLGPGVSTYNLAYTAPLNTAYSYTIKVASSSTSTNWSQPSAGITVWVDSLANTAPAAPDLTPGSDTGVSNTDNVTTQQNPTFSGNLPATAPSGGTLVTLWKGPFDSVPVGSFIALSGATSYNITATTALASGSYNMFVRLQNVSSAPAGFYFDSPALPITIDDGAAPAITAISQVSSPRNVRIDTSISITFNKPVYGFSVANLSLTRSGGANRLPGTATLTPNASSTVWSLAHIEDITMTAGNYSLSVSYNGTVKSVAGNVAATGLVTPMTWTQGSATNGYQNAVRYYDVIDNATGTIPPDGLVVVGDANAVINALNAIGAGPLPRTTNPSTPALGDYGYLDVNGSNTLEATDALWIINYLNKGYTYSPPGQSFAGDGGGGPDGPVDPFDLQADVVLQIVDVNGDPVTSVKVGQQFQLVALLTISGPNGVQPFAGYADVVFPSLLATALSNSGDIGMLGSTVAAGRIDEAGRVMYGDSTGLMFRKTFTAAKVGTATFTSDAADLFGHEIYVTGLNSFVPWSQVTFGSTTLTITN